MILTRCVDFDIVSTLKKTFLLFCCLIQAISSSFAEGILDDVNLKSIADVNLKEGIQVDSISVASGAGFYKQGDNLYFFKVDAQGQWTEDRYFMVSSSVWFHGMKHSHAIYGGTFSVTPLYVTKTLTSPEAKIKIDQKISYLQGIFENDPGISIKNSIQANLVAVSETATVSMGNVLSAFLALEAQLGSVRWTEFSDDGGRFTGFAPLSGSAEAGIIYTPKESLIIRLAGGITGDISYGKTRGSQTGVSPTRYNDYAAYLDFSVTNLNWGSTAFIQAGNVFRLTKPTVEGTGHYAYLMIGASVSGTTVKKIINIIK